MKATMLVLHFIGLAMAVGAGIAQGIVTRMMPSPPNAELVKVLRALRNATGVGLIVLWISGPALVSSKYGGFANLSTAFWIKLAFVVLLTIGFLIVLVEAAAGTAEACAKAGAAHRPLRPRRHHPGGHRLRLAWLPRPCVEGDRYGELSMNGERMKFVLLIYQRTAPLLGSLARAAVRGAEGDLRG